MIKRFDRELFQAKEQLTHMVPYRALAGFFAAVGDAVSWESVKRMTAYIEAFNREKASLPYTLGQSSKLGKEVHIQPEWVRMIQDNTVAILGWIQYEKVRWLQNNNPEVPGLVYKLAPMDEKMRRLGKVRKLWEVVLDCREIRDIFTGRAVKPKQYDIDYCIPWSFVMNDEFWNPMPMDSSLNIQNAAGADEPDTLSHSFDVQINTWRKLLEEKHFEDFRDSILYYIEKEPGGSCIGAETMMQLHQRVTELVLGYLVSHRIGSDRIFDEGLPYMEYMNSWMEISRFRSALEYISEKLTTFMGGVRQFNPVEEARLYIKQKIDDDITVAEIAGHVGMNPEYCTKLFKKATGLTLKEYIVQEKMDAAKVLLKTTDLPITLISSHVGYGNYSNFTRSFKQITGMTPMEYRNAEGQ